MHVNSKERHRTGPIGWLRATVLGANDGILSTSSLVLGVAGCACDSQRRLRRLGLYGGDARLLLDSLEYVQQTASRILTAIALENSGAPA